MCLIPGLGRPPGGGNGNLLQYSCLKKSQWTEEPDRPYSPNGHKKLDTTEQLNIHNTGLRFHVFKPLTHIQEVQEKRRCKARPGGVNPVPSKHESVGPWGQDG